MNLRACAFALMCLAPGPALAQDINLTCQGIGERTVANTAFGSVSGSGGYASGTFTTLGRHEQAESFGVSISGETAKIQVPRDLLPPLHGGGTDGWWDLANVHVSDREISGQYTLNLVNHPTVRIDRISGAISIDGHRQSFRGTCAVADVSARKF